MKTHTSTAAVLLPWLIAALMTACSSTPTHLFTLYAVPPASAPDSHLGAGAPVRVDAVHVPPALDRIEMVSTLGQGQLNISDDNHWSAPLGQEARQALSADLLARLPPGRLIFPHLAKPNGALGITVDLLEFKADGTGAWMQASWVIGPTDKGRPDLALLRTQRPVDGAAGTAQALSELLGLLADRIAAQLIEPIPP